MIEETSGGKKIRIRTSITLSKQYAYLRKLVKTTLHRSDSDLLIRGTIEYAKDLRKPVYLQYLHEIRESEESNIESLESLIQKQTPRPPRDELIQTIKKGDRACLVKPETMLSMMKGYGITKEDLENLINEVHPAEDSNAPPDPSMV
jgi:hypothetical protein